MLSLILPFAFIFGICIGSFLNVLIYRIPNNIGVSKGSSFCPNCNHNLYWADLVPVVSYIVLLGKCNYCKKPISFRYPFVEFLTGVLFALSFFIYGFSLNAFVYCIVSACLVSLAFIDFDETYIPDRFNITIFICGLILLIFTKDITILDRIIGLFAISVPLLIVSKVSDGMGEGDVKLFAACGLLLGWKLILLTMLMSSVMAALVGVFLIVTKKANGKTAIPFGPYIAVAVAISYLFGNNIITWYLRLLNVI